MSFCNLKSKAEYLLKNPEYGKTKDGLIELVCRDCDFWKEDDRDYECGAFKLLRLLLEKDMITVEEIVHSVSE